MTFLFRWNDSTEQRASQGQCAWWLTKDCLWFDTVISAHKGTDISLIQHGPASLILFLSSDSVLSLAFSLCPLLIYLLVCSLSLISLLNLVSSCVFRPFFTHSSQCWIFFYSSCHSLFCICFSRFCLQHLCLSDDLNESFVIFWSEKQKQKQPGGYNILQYVTAGVGRTCRHALCPGQTSCNPQLAWGADNF